MNTRTIRFLSIGILFAIVLAAVACAQAPATAARSPQEKLPGTWNVAAATPNQGAFPVLLTFTTEGSVIATESPFGPESAGQGSWKAGTDGQVAYTFASLLGSPEGKNTGKIRVIGKIQYDAAADGWQGPFQVRVTDGNGQELFADSGTFNLTRFAIEPLTSADVAPSNPTAGVQE